MPIMNSHYIIDGGTVERAVSYQFWKHGLKSPKWLPPRKCYFINVTLMLIVMTIITSEELKTSISTAQWRQLLFISTADQGSSPTLKSVFGNLITALVRSRNLESRQGWCCVNECRLDLHIHSAAQLLHFGKLLNSPQIIYSHIHLPGFTQPSTLTLTHSVAPFHPVTVPLFQSPINSPSRSDPFNSPIHPSIHPTPMHTQSATPPLTHPLTLTRPFTQ